MSLRSSTSRSSPVTRGWYFDTAVEALVCLLLIFAPLAYGSTQAWSQEVVLALISLAGVCVMIKRLVGDSLKLPWSWAHVVILLFVMLVALQLLPLPASVLTRLSPGTLQLKSNLLKDLPASLASSEHSTITFYSLVTRQQLIMVAAVAAMFLITIDVYRDAARIVRLLSMITLVGLGIALLAVYQDCTNATTIYGMVSVVHLHCGPFICYSHFSQFMNLSVGAALALLQIKIVALSTDHRGRYRSVSDWVAALQKPRNAMIWVALIVCILAPIMVFLSMSRMGMISLLSAAVFTGGAIALRARMGDSGENPPKYSPEYSREYSREHSQNLSAVLIMLALIVLSGLLYFGMDTVASRLGTVTDDTQLTFGTRRQILADIIAEFRNFPLLGSGLGTHEFVYPMFSHLNATQIATHAENEYAQLLEETGIVGLVLAVSFIVIIVANYLRATREQTAPVQYAAFGIGFGLVAVLIHSASDFGQHLPANAILTAIFCGLIVNLAAINRDRAKSPSPATRTNTMPNFNGVVLVGRFAGLALVLAVVALSLAWADRHRRAESDFSTAQAQAARLETGNWAGSDQEYIGLIAPAAQAVAVEPGNVTYSYFLSSYRWHALSRDSGTATGSITLPTIALPFVKRIADDLDACRPLCPSYGPPLCVAGQLKLYILNDASGREEIAEAYNLTPHSLEASLIRGELNIREKQWDDSVAAFSRYFALGGSYRDFIDLYVSASRPDLAYRIVSNNRHALDYMAWKMPSEPGWGVWVDRCNQDSLKLLMREANQHDATPDTFAELAGALNRRGERDKAIELYNRALAMNYGRVDWRFEMSKVMGNQGRFTDAVRELRICLRLQPQMSDAQALLAEYGVHAKPDVVAGQ